MDYRWNIKLYKATNDFQTYVRGYSYLINTPTWHHFMSVESERHNEVPVHHYKILGEIVRAMTKNICWAQATTGSSRSNQGNLKLQISFMFQFKSHKFWFSSHLARLKSSAIWIFVAQVLLLCKISRCSFSRFWQKEESRNSRFQFPF